MTREQISDQVTDVLVQALGVSPSEVSPERSLVGDLAAESIDFLDIVFRLEKGFGITISRGELFPQELLRDPQLVRGGVLTEQGATAIRQRFAFTDLSAVQAGTNVNDLTTDMLTVNLIIDYVESKLRAPEAAAVPQARAVET
jgi:acyl carrier protein